MDSALAGWRRQRHRDAVAAAGLVGSPSSSSSACSSADSDCSSGSSTTCSAPLTCSSLAGNLQQSVCRQSCFRLDYLDARVDTNWQASPPLHSDSCDDDDDDQLALLDHKLLSLGHFQPAELAQETSGSLYPASSNLKRAGMREQAAFQCAPVNRRLQHLNQPSQLRLRPAYRHLSAPVRAGQVEQQCPQHPTSAWPHGAGLPNLHLLYTSDQLTANTNHLNQESICSCSSSLDCPAGQAQFVMHQEPISQQQQQSAPRAHSRAHQLVVSSQSCASRAQSARQLIASGPEPASGPQEASCNQSKQFHYTSEATPVPPPPPPPPPTALAQPLLGQVNQNTSKSQSQVAALVHQSIYTTSTTDQTVSEGACLEQLEQQCDLTRPSGGLDLRPSAQVKQRQAVSFRRSATAAENQSSSAFVYSSSKQTTRQLAKQRNADLAAGCSPPRVRSSQPERQKSKQRSPRHNKTAANYDHERQHLAGVHNSTLARPSSATELGQIEELDGYNTNSLQAQHYPSMHQHLVNPINEALAAPIPPISIPAITSHRTNSPWMRISSIILTPIGIVIILFIVVSPLLHYLM